MKNTLKILAGVEMKIVFGGENRNYILPKFEVPKELIGNSLEKQMPFSSGLIDVNMKPNGYEILDEYIKEQQNCNQDKLLKSSKRTS